MNPNKYRLKTLSAVALAAAVSFGSNAQISENPIIIPYDIDLAKGFIYKDFDLENTTTFYVEDDPFSSSDPNYGQVPTWEQSVKIFDEDFNLVRTATIELKSADMKGNPGYWRYWYLLPRPLIIENNCVLHQGQNYTRTLFNTDDKLEYLTMDEETMFWIEGRGDLYRGMKVVSEDGRVLRRIAFPEGYFVYPGIKPVIYINGNSYYLNLSVEMENGGNADLIYRIEKEAGSVNFVTAMPSQMSVRSGDGVVTVDLPADADYSAVELVDMSGRVMGGVPVSGDRVSVDTSRLARGTYVLRAAGASGSECAKIVVR